MINPSFWFWRGELRHRTIPNGMVKGESFNLDTPPSQRAVGSPRRTLAAWQTSRT